MTLHDAVPGTPDPVFFLSNASVRRIAIPCCGIALGERMRGSARIIPPVR
ncbi:hypothetical protein [Azospirillum doebereinerae]